MTKDTKGFQTITIYMSDYGEVRLGDSVLKLLGAPWVDILLMRQSKSAKAHNDAVERQIVELIENTYESFGIIPTCIEYKDGRMVSV